MKVVLITGCSTGIGLATAKHLAARGDRVYATARNPEGAADLVAARARDANLLTLPLDVTDDRSVQTAVKSVLDAEGRIDAVVNNAGIGAFGTIEFLDEAVARATFETNFWGVLRVTRAVLPALRAQRSGIIVNISSVGGRIAGPAMGVYPASKYALEAASEALAREVYPLGIRVAIVEPGFVVTPILDKGLETLAPSPDSPYFDVERRIHGMFTNAKVIGATPESTAEVIAEAIDAREYKLRYPAGEGALVFLNGRARVSDEEWIALGRPMTDEEYGAEMGRIFS
jgi:NAD(P)-dependent dehydrogenase (short-subunit alcohol dehydrogenase family)